MSDDGAKRGVRPHLHEPNRLWPWVFRQHQVWVDVRGTEHEIESMPFDYVANVIGFCIRRAVWIYVLVVEDDGREISGPQWMWPDADDRLLMTHAAEWLETTPLMRALRRRLERAAAPAPSSRRRI